VPRDLLTIAIISCRSLLPPTKCVCGVLREVTSLAEGIKVDLRRDFWIRETGTGQQVAQLHDRYVMMMRIMIIIIMMMMMMSDLTSSVIVRSVRSVKCYVHVADEFTSLNKAK
jgi:hypothetical protein